MLTYINCSKTSIIAVSGFS